MFEVVERNLLTCLGSLKSGDVLATREDRRGELACQLDKPFAGIRDKASEQIGESTLRRDVETRIEGGAG